MATPLGTAQHDLGSLRIHEGQRKGSKLGKGLAIFFGGLVILGGIAGGVYAVWNQRPLVEVTTVHKPVGAGGREALLNASGYVTPRRRATIAAKIHSAASPESSSTRVLAISEEVNCWPLWMMPMSRRR